MILSNKMLKSVAYNVLLLCQEEQQVDGRVDKTMDKTDKHIELMRNLGDQFGDEGEIESEQRAKSAASKRPPDVVLEQINDTYTQRYCAI